MFTPAALHRTYHRQEYKKDQEENEDNSAKGDTFIALTWLLRRACNLGRFVGWEFELRHDAINARVYAANKITFLKSRSDVVADDGRGKAVGEHWFQTIAHLNPHFAFVGGHDQDRTIVLLGLALAVLANRPSPTKPIAIIRDLIAFEAVERCHHQLALGARLQSLKLCSERGLLLRVEQVCLIHHTSSKLRKILRNCCLAGKGQQ